MISLSKVISAEIDSAKRRIVKLLRLGKSDTQTCIEASPYGIDSNPIKDKIAVYAATGEKGKTVLIGYLNTNQKAETGQTRLFSTDKDGNETFYVWLKNNESGIGNLELGGTDDNAVRFQKLDDAVQDFKNLLQIELAKIQVGIAAGGGSYSPGTLTINLAPAKIEEITTP